MNWSRHNFAGRMRQAVFATVSLMVAYFPNATNAQDRVTTDEARILVDRLLEIRQPAAAREIALGLLRGDPNDVTALVALARSELALGRVGAAETAARAAKSVAQTPTENYIASLAMAEIFGQSERFTRSQFWLRRAIQSAPNPQSEQVAIEAFRRVRQANPLSVEINFGLTPSSNVNSGNANDAINFAFLPGVLGELQFLVPPDERPLSGLEVSLQTDFRYRIAESQTSRTSLEFGVYGRTYVMSDSARDAAPEVTGESLSYAQASVGVLHQWRPEGVESPYSANLIYSHNWAGGAPYSHELNGTLGTQITASDRDDIALSASVRHTNFFANDTDVVTYSLRGLWSRTLPNDNILGVTTQAAKATSTSTDRAYDEVTFGVSYDWGEVFSGNTPLGFDLATSITQKYRTYETSAFDPAGREDRVSSLRFDVGLNNVDFYGFQPVLTLQARRTDSTVQRFDTEGGQVGVNLRSSF